LEGLGVAPFATKKLPLFVNLVLAGATLNDYKLLGIEPSRAVTVIDVVEHGVSRCIKEFGNGADVEVDSAVVDDYDVFWFEFLGLDNPVHDVYIRLSFGREDKGFVNNDPSTDVVESVS